MAALAAAPAFAQSTAAAEAGGRTIDELTVTAQKREQNLQDVPIVVTSVNAQQLQDAGVRDIKDLTIVAPGLTVTSTSSSAITSARIRGVGTVGDNLGLESSVGVVIDGVYRPRTGVAFGDLGDLQRIEVLKGPQGTLFGKNTSAGVINILTKRPQFTFDANSQAEVSNYSGFGVASSITGPIAGDTVAARLFAAGRARDGFYKRVGGNNNDQNFYTVRGQLLVQASEDFDVNFAADYTRRNENCCGAVQIFNGATGALVNALRPGSIANPVDPKAYRDYGTSPVDKKIVDQGVSAEATWKTPGLGGATLTSITAARKWRQSGGNDNEWTGLDIIYTPLKSGDEAFSQFKQFSQEFRLAGATEKLNWLIGAFYTREDLDQRIRTVTYGADFERYLSGLLAAAGGLTGLAGRPPNQTLYGSGQGQNDTYSQKEEGFSLFTNNNFKVTEQLELTVGLRYTWEKKDLDSFWSNTDGAAGCQTIVTRLGGFGVTAGAAYPLICATAYNPRFGQIGRNSQHLKEDKLTGTAKVAYRFSPEVLAYVSYARGYKAGGFNLDRIAPGSQTVPGRPAEPVLNTSFRPETVDSYELGIKNTLLDRTLLLNATVFLQNYHDFQLNAFNGLFFTVSSVPKVVSRGVDTDFLWFTPVDGLTLNGGVTYAETYYPKSAPGAFIGARLPGSRLSLAPLWSVAGSASYEHPISDDLIGKMAINAKYVSSYNTGSDLNPIKNQKGFALVNARVGIGSANKRWQVEAWAQNLFDKYYYQVGFDATLQPGSYDAFLGMPRTYGMTLRLQY